MKTALLFILSLLVIITGFAWYIGVFTTVKVADQQVGGYKVIGREITGPYSEAGKAIEKVNRELKNKGVISSKSFGIYYDDPKTTPSEKCRSFLGVILEEKNLVKISKINTEGLKTDSIRPSAAVVAEFPLKISLSYMIGPMKTYPKLSKYIEEHKYHMTLSMEVYDMDAEKIIYIMYYNK